jgi:demethylmenaquinone methyltransferase/2-methoxy-6-polyprenyl-1,4-benzoquinol methylase
MRLRRAYYDLFSSIYDRVIALHSGDASARLRDLLIDRTGVQAGGMLLDLCSGTGAVALRAGRTTGADGLVVGLDFSLGMIRRAREKAARMGVADVAFVVADASQLPFASASFDAVSCSHAMYELRPEARERTLEEALRVLRPGGRFVMMEHCEPKRPLVRLLYRLRLSLLGSSGSRELARDEVPFLRRFFVDVKPELSPTGRSKLILGHKDQFADTSG